MCQSGHRCAEHTMPTDGSENGTYGDGEPKSATYDDGKDVPIPDYDEVRTSFERLKNGKTAEANGQPAELVNPAGKMIRFIH